MELLVHPSSRMGGRCIVDRDDVTNSYRTPATGAGGDAKHAKASGEYCVSQ